MSRCDASIDQKIRCELEHGHQGRHANGLLVWHEPPLILIDGRPPDMSDSEHWRDGEVRLSSQERSL